MYGFIVKENVDKKQDLGLKRKHTSNIQRRQMPSGSFLRTGQPDMLKMVQCKSEQEKPDQTRFPDTLKIGTENLSGISMDDVRVHYNSSRPAQLQALAYAKGTEIHLSSGQDRHLPHEAWHVVPQKQGRVRPTMQLGGNFINDNPVLEREADIMRQKAVQGKFGNVPVSVKNVTCVCMQRQIPTAEQLGDYKDKEGETAKKIIKTPLEAQDKVEALNKISLEAARIGKKVDEMLEEWECFNVVIEAKYMRRSTYKHHEKEYQTLVEKYKDLQSQIKDLDDNYDAERYEKDLYREAWEKECEEIQTKLSSWKDVTLSLEYQFRKTGVHLGAGEVGGPGYIVSVEKTQKAKSGENYRGIMKNEVLVGDETNTYSNRHVSTGDKSILEQTYKKNNKISETDRLRSENFDAYTKLAGEGARFNCVRRNIAKIKDDTVIHAYGEDKGVEFCELWKTWSASFDKKYDINDGEIATKLRDESSDKPKNTLWIRKNTTHTEAVSVDVSNNIELEQ